MSIISRHYRKILLLTALVLLSAISVGPRPDMVEAQTSTGPQISKLIVSGWTAHTALIEYTLSFPNGTCSNEATRVCSSDDNCNDSGTCLKSTQAEVQLDYGKSKSYNLVFPSSYEATSVSGSFNLTDLDAATTYHFRMRARGADATSDSAVSADKTFTTRSGDSAALPTATIQRVECSNTACTVTFSTTAKANVKLGWDTGLKSPTTADFCTPPLGYANCAGEVAGSFLSTSRSLRMTGLSGDTEYHYRLLSVDQSGGTSMSGSAGVDLIARTSANDTDRTFSTGGCVVEGRTYPIGSCLPNGGYCANDAVIDERCNNDCGYSCEAGQTCNASGACLVDPLLGNSPYQCNKSSCYDGGVFLNPAPVNCYSSWPKCSANTILKVTKDRACNLWMTCGTSVQSTPSNNQTAENLCLSLAACNQLGANGVCTHYLPQGQCDNDPLRFCSNDYDCLAGGTCNVPSNDNPTQSLRDLTFTTPQEIKSIANLSGNVVAGLDWASQGGSRVIQGDLPWQLMRQIGSNVPLKNSDFESSGVSYYPWKPVPTGDTSTDALAVIYEDKDNSINHVLKISPAVTANGGAKTVYFSGAASEEFNTVASEYYYAQARIRSESGNPIVRFELGYDGFSKFSVKGINTYIDVQTTTAWQTVSIGPIKGLSGATRVGIVLADNNTLADFLVDDIQVKPVLQVNTNPDYLTPSCRLYPKDDAPACDYTDTSGVTYKGWKGYCLETDYDSGACLSWWPVDIISGESDIFGAGKVSGYQDQSPLYYCAEARGWASGNNAWSSMPYTVGVNYADRVSGSASCTGTPGVGSASCYTYYHDWSSSAPRICTPNLDSLGFTIGNCHDSTDWQNDWIYTPASGADAALYEGQITRAVWNCANNGSVHCNANGTWWSGSNGSGTGVDDGSITFDNTSGFQASSGPDNAAITGGGGEKLYRQVFPGDGIYWVFSGGCSGAVDCVAAMMRFDLNGRFTGYYLRSGDNSGSSNEQDMYRVTFTVKEVCEKIVEVVSPTGLNAAWAGRINSRSNTVTGLGYRRSTDVLPYSAIAPAAPTDDPTSWPMLTIQTKTDQFDNGQYRSGSPYACTYNCGAGSCQANNTLYHSELLVNQCIVTRGTSACGSADSDGDGKSDTFCTGGVAAASNKSSQTFDNSACINIDAGTGIGTCQGTTRLCTVASSATCDATVDADGEGKTVQLSRIDAENDCRVATSTTCSNPRYSCTSRDRATNCESNGGTCSSTYGAYKVACDGRCGGNGEYRRFTAYLENANGLSCVKTTNASCVMTNPGPTFYCGDGYGNINTHPTTVCNATNIGVQCGGGSSYGLYTCHPEIPRYFQCMDNVTNQPTGNYCSDPRDTSCGWNATCKDVRTYACQSCTTIPNPDPEYNCDDTGNACDPANTNACGRRPALCKEIMARCTSSGGTTGNECLVVGSPCYLSGDSHAFDGICRSLATTTCSPTYGSCSSARTNSPECGVTETLVGAAAVAACSTDGSNCTCKSVGKCSVTENKTYTSYGAEAKTCRDRSDCVNDGTYTADELRYYAQENIKRLFAQSYGIWVRSGQSYVKQDGSDPTELDGGIDNTNFYGWKPPSEICQAVTTAPAGTCSYQDNQPCRATLDITSRGATEALARSAGATQCTATTACNGQKTQCSTFTDAKTKVRYDSFDVKSCTEMGRQYICTGTCTVNNEKTYTNVYYAPSTDAGTTKITRPNTRPGDYCAIPPQAQNIAFTTGNAKEVTINGGGSIGIKFNSTADVEQMPLQNITVDWGDGAPQTFSYPYAPRTDSRKPHILSHVYNYNKADNAHCPARGGPCTYTIRVQIKDGWGWCSSASRIGDTTKPDGVADDRGCTTDSTLWTDSGLRVVLEP